MKELIQDKQNGYICEEIKSNNVMKERYDFIDLMKSIAIIMVLIYHNIFFNISIVESNNIQVYMNYLFTSLLSCCVPLFFFINGALLLNKKLDIKKHTKKIIRIIIITEIWACITLLLMMVAKEQILNIKEFFKAMWQWKSMWINHLWFLPSLVVIYIFFPVIKSAYDNNKSYFKFFLVVTLVCTFGNKLLYMFMNILHNNFLWGEKNLLNNYNAFRGIYGYSIGYFMIGGICFKYKDKFKKKNFKEIAIILYVCSLIGLGTYGICQSNIIKKTYDIVWNGYDTVFTLINVIAIFVLTLSYQNKKNAIGKLIKLIAENSLGIYCIHQIISAFLMKLYILLPFARNTIASIAYAFVLLGISLIACLVFKKLRLIKELFKI